MAAGNPQGDRRTVVEWHTDTINEELDKLTNGDIAVAFLAGGVRVQGPVFRQQNYIGIRLRHAQYFDVRTAERTFPEELINAYLWEKR